MSTTAGREEGQQHGEEEQERSGRYPIDPRLLTGRGADGALHLRPANSQQPPVGVFGSAVANDDVLAIDDELDSLVVPAVPTLPPPVPNSSERAELQIEDLSLMPGNPFAASSLVPAPHRSEFPWRKVLTGAAIGLVVVGGLSLASYVIGSGGTPASARKTPTTERQGVVASRPAQRETVASAIAAPAPSVSESTAIASLPDVVEQAQGEPVEAAASDVAKTEVSRPNAAAPRSVDRAPALGETPATQSVPTRANVPAPLVASKAVASRPAAGTPSASEMPKAQSAPDAVAISPDAPPAAPAEGAAEAEALVGEPAAADLPEKPSRDEVIATFEDLRPALTECAAGQSGLLEVKATVTGDGRVAHALIGGDFQGPAGSCMARVVRKASFPKFAQDKLGLAYPMSL